MTIHTKESFTYPADNAWPTRRSFHGHPGFAKVYEDIGKLLYWPRRITNIEKYIKTCHRCEVNKHYRQATLSPLQLMLVHESPWDSISLDFITNLTKRKGYDSILVVVCCLSKIARFIQTPAVALSKTLSQIVIQKSRLRSGRLCSRLWKRS